MEQAHHSDRDEVLARRIGQLREEGRPLSSDAELTNDPLGQALLAFAAEATPVEQPERRERIWRQLEVRMHRRHAADRPMRRRSRRSPVWHRALALAVILLAAGLGWWLYVGREAAPVLVASADTVPRVYTAPDGSQITLRPHSRLYVRHQSTTVLRYRLEGEAFFDVVHRPERRFQVEAGPVRVTVLGTRFDVRTWGGVEIFLETGRVQLEGPRGQRQVLTAGQRSRLMADGRLSPPEPAAAAAYLDWMQGQLTFVQESAAQVVAEVAYHFGVQITVPEPYAAQTLSGTLSLDSLAQVLEDLGRVLGGHFVEIAPERYRFEANAGQ
ncbi:MAG: FecR domain-containing protein [Rhodothermus sp.]|nr:FecR domain-containing protein [Rhodothermus sp.]